MLNLQQQMEVTQENRSNLNSSGKLSLPSNWHFCDVTSTRRR